jgi:hypothetical protein
MEKLCVPFPRPKQMKIRLPFGTDLNSIVDISKGPPTDCALIHGLMLQLTPALAGMECILKLFKLVAVLKNISVSTLPDIAKAAKDLGECLGFAVKIPLMITDILKLIIAYLKCLIEAVLSVLQFQAGLAFDETSDNALLQVSLKCAQSNAEASLQNLKDAMAVVQALLILMEPIMLLASGPLPEPVQKALEAIPEGLKTLSAVFETGGVAVGVPGVEGPVQTLTDLKNTLTEIQATLEALP